MSKIIKSAAIIGLLAISSQASAALLSFENGGFDGFLGNTNSWNSSVPDGWSTVGGTPDVFNQFTDFQDNTWGASNSGGNFLHALNISGYVESAVQVGLAGLVIGQQYEISFEQSITNNQWSSAGGFWDITFGTETHSSAQMNLPGTDIVAGWEWQTLLFTATDTIQTLQVSAGRFGGARSDVGIDGFFIGSVGEQNPHNPVNVPEPTTIGLFGIFLAGLGLKRRKSI
jgi:hypothetical protein